MQPYKKRTKIDHFSALPDDIIHKIIDKLPAKTAVSTAVLSRRWRKLWTETPHLRFDQSQFENPRRFIDFAAKTLDLHHGDLRSLEFFADDHEEDRNLDRLYAIFVSAARRNLRLQEICIHLYQDRRPFVLPSALLKLEFLVYLDFFVVNGAPIDWMGNARLPNLERLDLGGVSFNGDLGEDVVSVCFPRLRSWKLSECQGLRFFTVESEILGELEMICCRGIVDVKIRCSGLRKFSFKHCFEISRIRRSLAVSAASIDEFTWLDIPPDCFEVGESMKPSYSSLGVPIMIRYRQHRGASDLLLSLANSRKLEIDSYFFEALFLHIETKFKGHCIPKFSNIEVLRLSICFGPEQVVMLSAILGSLDNVKKLALSFVELPRVYNDYAEVFVGFGDRGEGGYWNSQFLSLNNLHQVDISNFSGGEFELNFIEFLLRSVASLRIIKIIRES